MKNPCPVFLCDLMMYRRESSNLQVLNLYVSSILALAPYLVRAVGSHTEFNKTTETQKDMPFL